jgi:hypothetical protein
MKQLTVAVEERDLITLVYPKLPELVRNRINYRDFRTYLAFEATAIRIDNEYNEPFNWDELENQFRLTQREYLLPLIRVCSTNINPHDFNTRAFQAAINQCPQK